MNVLKTILNLRLILSSLQNAVFSLTNSSTGPYFLKYILMKDWKILAGHLVQFMDLFGTKNHVSRTQLIFRIVVLQSVGDIQVLSED